MGPALGCSNKERKSIEQAYFIDVKNMHPHMSERKLKRSSLNNILCYTQLEIMVRMANTNNLTLYKNISCDFSVPIVCQT